MKAVGKVEKLMRGKEFIGLYDKEEADRLEKKAMERHEEGQKEGIKTAICNVVKHNIDIPRIATIMNLKQSEVSKYLL